MGSAGVVVKEEDTQAWVSFAEQASWHCQKDAQLNQWIFEIAQADTPLDFRFATLFGFCMTCKPLITSAAGILCSASEGWADNWSWDLAACIGCLGMCDRWVFKQPKIYLGGLSQTDVLADAWDLRLQIWFAQMFESESARCLVRLQTRHGCDQGSYRLEKEIKSEFGSVLLGWHYYLHFLSMTKIEIPLTFWGRHFNWLWCLAFRCWRDSQTWLGPPASGWRSDRGSY